MVCFLSLTLFSPLQMDLLGSKQQLTDSFAILDEHEILALFDKMLAKVQSRSTMGQYWGSSNQTMNERASSYQKFQFIHRQLEEKLLAMEFLIECAIIVVQFHCFLPFNIFLLSISDHYIIYKNCRS